MKFRMYEEYEVEDILRLIIMDYTEEFYGMHRANMSPKINYIFSKL
jgi:hypothetical protein